MRFYILLAFAALSFSVPARAQSELGDGFAGALRGCEEWILNPASWTDGPEPFLSAVGLGGKMGLVDRVEDINLPPKNLRRGNYYWRINSAMNAGYILVVSDQIPMCHITGGGSTDLQPVVESELSSPDLARRWELLKTVSKSGMNSTTYRSREEKSLSIVISRAKGAWPD